MENRRSLLIGVDGNEANIQQRVGVNQFALGLLRGLWANKTKHRFLIYLSTPPASDLPREKYNWHYRVIGPPKLWTQWSLPLNLFFHRPRPDVFFSPSHYAPRFAPMPTVIAIMDLGFLRNKQEFRFRDYFKLRNWTAYSIKNAKHIIAISQYTKKDLIINYQLPPEKITVIYPGFENNKFFPRDISVIRKVLTKYDIEPPYLLFLSSLKPSKNVERLIQAYAKCIREKAINNSIKLVIAGKKAWLYEEIFRKAKNMGLTGKIIFTGFFPEEDLPYLVSGCQAFIMPSLFEGFGIPVLEAMASGVPVVVSNVSSLPEIVGKDGIYVDPYNTDDIARSLRYVSNLSNLQRSQRVNNGLKRVPNFSWDKATRETLAVLENVIQ